MGSAYSVKCNQCHHEFSIRDGGGFFFHLLHCDHCGKEKSVPFREIPDLNAQYINRIERADSNKIQSTESDLSFQDNSNVIETDRERVEEILPPCSCGGKFIFDASARCPKCGSIDLQEIPGEYIFYD